MRRHLRTLIETFNSLYQTQVCCYSEDETEASSPGSLAEQQGSVAHPGHHMEAGGWYQVYLHYIYIISTLYLHYIYIISTLYLHCIHYIHTIYLFQYLH